LAAGFFQKDTDQRPRISAARSRQSSASAESPRICLAPKGAIHFNPAALPRDLWIKIREALKARFTIENQGRIESRFQRYFVVRSHPWGCAPG
jgi:hypothetical protein